MELICIKNKNGEEGMTAHTQGQIYRIAGPVVTVTGINPRMYDVVFIGDLKLN